MQITITVGYEADVYICTCIEKVDYGVKEKKVQLTKRNFARKRTNDKLINEQTKKERKKKLKRNERMNLAS